MKLWIGILLLFFQTDSFKQFTFCIEKSRGPFESQCVQLDAAGKGQGRFKRRGADEIKVPIALSNTARDRFLSVLKATNNIENGENFESGRKVADLGKKHLTLELPDGKTRESIYNYSILKEVSDLGSFFEGVINEEMIGLDIDNAIQYDRLSIPKHVEHIENEMKSNRISDPERLIPILEKIQNDKRLIDYARARAGKLKDQIVAKKAR